jgi:hypothetical protein
VKPEDLTGLGKIVPKAPDKDQKRS